MELCVCSTGMLRKQDCMLAHSNPTLPLICVHVSCGHKGVNVHQNMFTYSKSPNHVNRSEPSNLHILQQDYAIHPSDGLWACLTATWLCDVWCSYVSPRSMEATKCSGYIREQDKDYSTVEWENSLKSQKHLQVLWDEWLTFEDNRAHFRSWAALHNIWLSHWPWREKGWLKTSSVSFAKKRQFFVWSLSIQQSMLIIVTYRSMHRLSRFLSWRFFVKNVPIVWMQSLWSCKSWRNAFQEYWVLHWSVFPVHGTLPVWSTPSSFSTMASSTGPPHPPCICQHHGELRCLVFVLLWVEAAGGHFTWLDLQTLWKLLFW